MEAMTALARIGIRSKLSPLNSFALTLRRFFTDHLNDFQVNKK